MGALARVDRLLTRTMPRFRDRAVRLLRPSEELRRLRIEIERLRPGHYYSPIPAMDDIRARAERIFDRSLRDLPGINLNVERQLKTLETIRNFYPEQPFTRDPQPGFRYYFNNGAYGHGDGIFLYGMMRLAQPRQIIEIGSGHSSHLMLDVNDRFFEGRLKLTFIEPYDERLRSRLREEDCTTARIIAAPVQDVPVTLFDELEANDILFVDSSHVAKIGSDVNHIFFEILPRLKRGVYVHFHDMVYPFEYPEKWIEASWFWNEAYLLRAFLQFNSSFEIVVWNNFLLRFHRDRLESMPYTLGNVASLWLQRAR